VDDCVDDCVDESEGVDIEKGRTGRSTAVLFWVVFVMEFIWPVALSERGFAQYL
jgi:hypothetical protein